MANSVSIDALRQELWSKELLDDVMRDVKNVNRFMGEDSNNVIQVRRELKKVKGDTQTFGLLARLSGPGVTGDDELEGNEESANSYAEQVAIDQIRNAIRTKGRLDSQKVSYDDIKEYKELARIWMKEFICRQIFFKLAGVTNTLLVDTEGITVGTRATWSNTPDFIADADTASATGAAARYLNAAGHSMATADGNDILTLDLITKAATKARLSNPKIQPLSFDGDDFYVMYVHPFQARDIRTSSAWKTAQQDAQIRGEKNPVFRGALGYWSNVLLLENEFVPYLDISSAAGHSWRGAATGTDYGVDSAAAVLCGRQAVLMAEASNPDALVVETFDYKNKDGVACSFIGGLQKTMFNSKEFGVILVDSAAVA